MRHIVSPLLPPNATDLLQWQVFRRQILPLPDSLQVVPWSVWTPVFTGVTDVGGATYVGRFNLDNRKCYFQLSITPGVTVATVAGTTYFALPTAPGPSGLAGDASMENVTTLVGIGLCVFDLPNARCYVPSQGATGNVLVAAGWFEV